MVFSAAVFGVKSLMEKAGVGLLAVTSGTAAVMGLLVTLSSLTENPHGFSPTPPGVVTLATVPPPVEPDNATAPSPLVAEKSNRASKENRPQLSASSAPPLPVFPDLEWASPLTGTVTLSLPAWTEAEVGPEARGNEMGSARASQVRETPFAWVFAPELTSVEAMAKRYPRRALHRGVAGMVVLAVETGATGRVVDARVVSSSPRGVFDATALAMVKSWRGSRADRRNLRIRFQPQEVGF